MDVPGTTETTPSVCCYPDPQGRLVYFPYGILGPGYMVDDGACLQRLQLRRRLLLLFNTLLTIMACVLCIVASGHIGVALMMAAAVLGVGIVLREWLYVRSVRAKLQRSAMKLTPQIVYTTQAARVPEGINIYAVRSAGTPWLYASALLLGVLLATRLGQLGGWDLGMLGVFAGAFGCLAAVVGFYLSSETLYVYRLAKRTARGDKPAAASPWWFLALNVAVAVFLFYLFARLSVSGLRL